MSRWDALGPLYAKLGLSTSADIIAARKNAAEAGYQAFKSAHLAGLVRGALGLGQSADAEPLFAAMRAKDPTLDVQPSDKEASTLLGAIASAEMRERTSLGGLVALGLVTASFGGTRQSPTAPDLAADADKCLADVQLASGAGPRVVAAGEVPDDLTAALDAMGMQQTNYGQVLNGTTAMAAIKKVAEHATAAHAAAAVQANAAMAYARRLEEELRAYWWVVGGWSDGLRKPFHTIALGEAALRAGSELADKTTLPLGLFAAPALIDKALRQDRKGRLPRIGLADAVEGVDPAWRRLSGPAAAAQGVLLPVTLALQLSAESGDADDWRPQFARTTRIAADVSTTPLQLGLQLHREKLLSRALLAAK